MKIRDRLPLLAVLCCFSALLLLPEVSAQAARDAMLLCAQTLIPSLFPFFVLSSLLIACGASELLSALLSPLMRPLFGLSGTGAAALALGLCGGYPVGARTAAELVENGALSQEEGERLLAFCNNAGPGFLLGVCGAGVFSSSRAGAALYLIHVAAALDRYLRPAALGGTAQRAQVAACHAEGQRRIVDPPDVPEFDAPRGAEVQHPLGVRALCAHAYTAAQQLDGFFQHSSLISHIPRCRFCRRCAPRCRSCCAASNSARARAG